MLTEGEKQHYRINKHCFYTDWVTVWHTEA